MFKMCCGKCNECWYVGNDRTCTCLAEKSKWQGLTDDEALECWPGLAMYADCVKFWENIEAKLKAKNDN